MSVRPLRRVPAAKWLVVASLIGAGVVIPSSALGAGGGGVACVNPAGSAGCFTSITAAVNSVGSGGIVTVAAGTYREQVVVDKSLTLRGAGVGASIIDATGKPNGITVTKSGGVVSGVTIQGFTIENANNGGVLFGNAASVMFLHNRVANNDKGRTVTPEGVICPGVVFPFDEEDCGEGVTIAGLANSIVSDNVVENNVGGILVSDELAPTHDNQIVRNIVRNNTEDCGITLASHGPGHQVYRNTIFQNTSSGNGGAGVGLFAPIPGTGSHDNVVVQNTLTNNGMPGVAMHSHAPDQNVNNNTINGNTISGNALDPGVSTAPTGISISAELQSGAKPITGTTITQNTISNEAIDIWVGTNATSVEVHLNNLGAPAIGIENAGTGTINAQLNYWGCPGGPGASGCATTQGPNVITTPFLRQPVR